MLSNEALQTLTAQAVAAANIQIETGGHSLLLKPKDFTLTNLEPFQLERDRFRGALATHSLADFASYVERHIGGQEDTGAAGFINQDNMSAVVVFNLGSQAKPGHGDDQAYLTLKATAAYSALCNIVGKGLTQQQLAEFLEDWAPHVAASAGDQKLETPLAINAIRRMTIKATAQRDSVVGDLSNSRSSMDEIEAKSLETLPTTFIFTAKPYEALQAAHITLRLSVITGRDEPVLKLRWVAEEAQREEFADEFKQVLEREVGGFLPLTIGTYAQGQ